MTDIVEKLENSVAMGRARHAYLLSGADSERTDSVARRIAALLLFGEPDTERLTEAPDCIETDGSITIARFRDELLPEIYRETYASERRAVIFRSAHLLSQMVQNAMLKVLEEPPENTHFILTGNEYGLLPTIRSRCTIVRCPAPKAEEIERELISRGANRITAQSCAAMSGGVTGRAVRLYEDESFRAMRSELYSAFFAAALGKPDFGFTKAKRERTDWMEANELLLLLAHDLMRTACGFAPDHCADRADEIKNLCSVFTIGDFGCIIDRLTETAQRIATNASGSAAFDRLFASVATMRAK